MIERKRVGSCLAVSLACLVAAGCSSSRAGSSPDAGGESGSVSCVTDPLVDPALSSAKPAALPLMKPGKSGMLSFVLVQMSEDPPGVSPPANSWTIKVLDSSGAAVKDAMLTFPRSPCCNQPWMPRMTHGSSLPLQEANNGDGTYTISNMSLSMAGLWRLTVQAQSGAMTDEATFTWCVP